jgi:hypothetical protein
LNARAKAVHADCENEHMTSGKTNQRGSRRLFLARPMVIGMATMLGDISSASAAPTATEAALIEAVIQRVAAMTNLVFVRNGATASSVEAAKHMRDKYEYFRRDIVTAEDFIRLCGTRSELTLQPYRVRKQDGSEQLTADLLGAELRALRLKVR